MWCGTNRLAMVLEKYYSHLSPAWDGSVVYVADRHGVVKALELETGKEIWSQDLSTKKVSSPLMNQHYFPVV